MIENQTHPDVLPSDAVVAGKKRIGPKPAIVCRFCKQGGVLCKGAHRECKNAYMREYLRKKKGITPDRYISGAEVDPICFSCRKQPRQGGSRLCLKCAAKRKVDARRKRRQDANNNLPEKVCKCGCGQVFKSKVRNYYSNACRLTSYSQKQKRNYTPRPPQPKRHKRGPSETPMKSLADTRVKRAKREIEEVVAKKLETIITPEGLTITKIAAFGWCARGLRNLFGDESGATWNAAD